MKKWILQAFGPLFFLVSSGTAYGAYGSQTGEQVKPSTPSTVPYLSEYRDGEMIIVFHGNILPENETQVNLAQTKYLESLYQWRQKSHYKQQLRSLGITIDEIYDDPRIPSENLRRYEPMGH